MRLAASRSSQGGDPGSAPRFWPFHLAVAARCSMTSLRNGATASSAALRAVLNSAGVLEAARARRKRLRSGAGKGSAGSAWCARKSAASRSAQRYRSSLVADRVW